MADNRVVIKINYDNDQYRKTLIDPKMVTVWHTQRIIFVIALLLLLGLAIFWAISSVKTEQNKVEINQENNPPAEVLPPVSETIKSEIKPISPQLASDTKKAAEVKRPPAIIFDKRVIRASLNSAPKNDEPGDPIKMPIILEKGQSLELFYFSQIKNLKASALFHAWYKNGLLVIKKQFNLKSNGDKLISSRKLTDKDVGEWRVTLVDNKGKVFSEVNYSVNP